MKKSAFTLIELVFVIIVLGILASLAMGRMERD
ncbi:MAG TPA: type II secretion system protein, partial [Campylobacterales bacterium]|nr:type II secretion system protein [Campylobacterales bacterium]